MGTLSEDAETQILFTCMAVILAFCVSFCVSLILCCFLKRRNPIREKCFIRLSPPRPSFCTLISNNTPYQRVLEEYGDKMVEMQLVEEVTSVNDQSSTKQSNKRKLSSGSSGKRRQSEEKDSNLQFVTSIEFPQWKCKKNVENVPTQYNL